MTAARLRVLATLLYDIGIAVGAFWLALALRYDFSFPPTIPSFAGYALLYGALCGTGFAVSGLARAMWRYTSTRDLVTLVQVVSFSLALCGGIMFFLTRLEHFPRSAFAILWLLHLVMAAGPRVAVRLLREKLTAKPVKTEKPARVLLVGAGDGADLFLREVERQKPQRYLVAGLIDDEPAKMGRRIHGVPVLGPVRELPAVLEKCAKKRRKIDFLVVSGDMSVDMEALFAIARTQALPIRRLPSFSELKSGEVATNLRPVNIEDLLGRPPIRLEMAPLAALLRGRRVLVTGAGGSIGSEICRQVASFEPQQLMMLENSEHALYQIDMEIAEKHGDVPRKSLLADVRDKNTLEEIFTLFKPEIVFHAAAYKHVPMVENNPIAGMENNLLGTMRVAEACRAHGVARMVLISTDKAVNPTNVMGATKRAAEIYCQSLPQEPTRFVAVRFGNVLGSTGSVVPLFSRQIREGGPITVTHKEATRYFMTIPEAVQLVLQAATLEGENDLYMLDMGKPVRIYDMAEEMVRLSGLTPHADIKIKEIGLRPGEKLFEELWYDAETMERTGAEKIFRVKAGPGASAAGMVERIATVCRAGDAFQAVATLCALVPEYTPAPNSPFAESGECEKEAMK